MLIHSYPHDLTGYPHSHTGYAQYHTGDTGSAQDTQGHTGPLSTGHTRPGGAVIHICILFRGYAGIMQDEKGPGCPEPLININYSCEYQTI